MTPIYLHHETPRDLGMQALPPLYPSQFDVVATDSNGRQLGRWPWYYTQSKPTRRNRYVMLNCARRRVIWKASEQ